MAENKKSFVLYADLIKVIEQLPDEIAGKLFKIILQYVNDKEIIVDDLLLKIAFEPIKLQLKRDLKKYEKTIETKSNSGALGNLKRWNKDLYDKVNSKEITLKEAIKIAKHRTAINDIANIAVNDTVTVTVNDTVTDNDILFKKETKTGFDFLKENAPGEIEIFEMQNKKSFINEDYDAFISNFNEKIILEEIDFDVGKLMARLRILNTNWNKKRKKENSNNGTTKPTINRQSAETIHSNSKGWEVE